MHTPGTRRCRQGVHGRVVQMAPVRRGKGVIAGTEVHLRRRAVPQVAGRPVQRTRVAELHNRYFYTWSLARTKRQEHPFRVRGAGRPAPEAAPQGEAPERTWPGGAPRNATRGRHRTLDRRVPARRGERLEGTARQRTGLFGGRSPLFHGDCDLRLSSWTLAHAGPQFRWLCHRTSVCLRRG